MLLRFLYRTKPGRMILKLLTWPAVSRASGRFLNSRISCILIPGFIKKNEISMEEYEQEKYRCFNDFFCRHIRKEARPISMGPDDFIAPCDGLLSAYHIEDGLVIPVKESHYRIEDLLRNQELAREFDGGYCLVFRLCVNHYHRYCYPDSGVKSANVFLPGILHTVRPVALREVPVFTENSREYTIIDTDHFGKIVQMEVGAMLVGRIDNYMQAGSCEKGQEKGRFLYGGSTIIVLTAKDRIRMAERVFEAAKHGKEIPVRMGQKIARRGGER